MNEKHKTIFTGHYGSGKTTIALNWAYRLGQRYDAVSIADLDIVNPYFRTADHERSLNKQGIHLIKSQFACSNLDVPAISAELYAVLEDKNNPVVLDVGGDESGAAALGRYAPYFEQEQDYEMLFVVNFYRPMTQTAESALDILKKVEAVCHTKCTGLINNSNLGLATKAAHVLATCARMDELSKNSGVPIKMVTVDKRLMPELTDKIDLLHALERPREV